MTGSPLSEQLTQVFDELRQHRDRIAKVQQELSKATVSVTARDRSLSVEVGSQGELRDVRFHSEDYRTMPAAELSALLVQLCNDARRQMAEKVTASYAPLTSFAAEMRKSMIGGSDSEEALEMLRSGDSGDGVSPLGIGRD